MVVGEGNEERKGADLFHHGGGGSIINGRRRNGMSDACIYSRVDVLTSFSDDHGNSRLIQRCK